ncbi:MAG: ribokinase [Nakamurella sp.]
MPDAETPQPIARPAAQPTAQSTTRPTVTVVGSINMDLVATADRLPAPGETVSGNAFATIPGGKGANQAIAAARAGVPTVAVSMVGAVGSDSFAAGLLAALNDGGVATDLVRIAPGPSGIAQITVDAAAENSIVVVPGANATLTKLRDADRAAITGARIVVLQLEIPLDGVVEAAQLAASAGVSVLLNPSPVRDLPDELLDAITVLVVNEGEAAALGQGTLARVAHLVTTLGPLGAHYQGPDGHSVSVAAPSVDAIDTTGAGDAFTGALAVAWVQGLPPAEALQRACAAGALATTVRGASTSSPTRAAIDELVAVTY